MEQGTYTLSPMDNQLFIQKAERIDTYGSGIIQRADKYRKSAHEGEVIAHGTLDYKGIETGMTILFASYSDGESFALDDGMIVTVVKEDEILAYWRSTDE